MATGQSSSGWHRLQRFIECRRAFGFSYVLGLEPVIMPKPLAMGTAIHAALEAYYRGDSWQEVLDSPEVGWAYVVPQARKIVTAYMEHWMSEKEVTISVEKEYAVTLRGRTFTRRMDRIVELGRMIYGHDHKTSYDPTRRAAGVSYEGALFTQELVGRAHFGARWGGLVLNLIGKGEPFVFNRELVSGRFPAERMARAPHELATWLEEADRLQVSGKDPWSDSATFPSSWQCQGRYSLCEFFPLCEHGKVAMREFQRRAR